VSQIFHRSLNTLSKISIFGTIFIIAALTWVFSILNRATYITQVHVARQQPVPFSHQHHVGGLGLDCRYCHSSVEESSFAGMPPTKTCMNCHSQIWSNSPMLKPVRDSYNFGIPIAWTRVNNLPGFVYFDHSIHINRGVGCETCHGRVDLMPLTWKAQPLQMEWCLDCHRQPERFLRPRKYVFTMGYQPPIDQIAIGEKLAKDYHIRSTWLLTSCSTCHR